MAGILICLSVFLSFETIFFVNDIEYAPVNVYNVVGIYPSNCLLLLLNYWLKGSHAGFKKTCQICMEF